MLVIPSSFCLEKTGDQRQGHPHWACPSLLPWLCLASVNSHHEASIRNGLRLKHKPGQLCPEATTALSSPSQPDWRHSGIQGPSGCGGEAGGGGCAKPRPLSILQPLSRLTPLAEQRRPFREHSQAKRVATSSPTRPGGTACVPGKNSTLGGETNRKGGKQARPMIGHNSLRKIGSTSQMQNNQAAAQDKQWGLVLTTPGKAESSAGCRCGCAHCLLPAMCL